MTGSIRMRSGAILRWLILALLWFGPLNTPHLFEPDEGRYAEIPREMVVSGDWVTPRLDGIKYFEKPALQYWATAAAFTLFGQHAWTARLWSALSAYLGLLLSFALARRLYDERTARLAVIVQASSLLYIGLSRITTLDMSLCFSLQLAMYALTLLAQQRATVQPAKVQGAASTQESAPSSTSPARWQLPLLLGIGIALAVLSKGLVGILIPAAVAGAAMVEPARAAGAGGSLVPRGLAAQSRVRTILFCRAALSTLPEHGGFRSLRAGVVLHSGAGSWNPALDESAARRAAAGMARAARR
jgi:4-amino-4-deoxy-L-arabinose transferase-like glycosyltransferase